MSQLFILLSIIFIYFLYKMAKRSHVSLLNFSTAGDQKTPEDHLPLLYLETQNLTFVKNQAVFVLDPSIVQEPNAEKYGARIVEAILDYLQVPNSGVKVSYTAKNEPPRVQLNDFHGFDFYIPADLKQSKGAIQSLLAYECTRIFMAFQRREFAEKVKSRHLYDYTSIFIGLGLVFLNDLEDLVDLLRHIEPEFSYYINTNNLLFVSAVYYRQQGVSLEFLASHLKPEQIHTIQRIQSDLEKAPYKLLQKDAFDATICCQNCFQVLRVPAEKKLKITCSTCGSQFEAKT